MTKPEDMLSDGADGALWLDALDGEVGPARPLSEAEALAFVERVQGRVAFVQPRPIRRLPFGRKLGVAAAVFAAASAAAAVYTLRTQEPRGPAAASPPAASPPAASLPASKPVTAPNPTEPSAVPGVPQAAGAEAAAGRADAAPSAAGPSAAVPSAAVPAPSAADLTHAEKLSDPTQAGTVTSAGEPAPTEPTRLGGIRAEGARRGNSHRAAADRLAEANALRGRHRYRDALGLYLQVSERYPSSIQASAARVAAAAIRLEQFGDVQGAERLYREAKTSGGQLTPEAQFGLSEVSRARGDIVAERRALGEFVVRYPDSPLVSAAKRRLRSLEQ